MHNFVKKVYIAVGIWLSYKEDFGKVDSYAFLRPHNSHNDIQKLNSNVHMQTQAI